MGQLGVALLHRAERFERRYELARRVEAHRQATIAHPADLVGQALGIDPDPGRVFRPGGDHAPLSPLLGDGRCGERARPQSGAARQNGTSIHSHGSLPPLRGRGHARLRVTTG